MILICGMTCLFHTKNVSFYENSGASAALGGMITLKTQLHYDWLRPMWSVKRSIGKFWIFQNQLSGVHLDLVDMSWPKYLKKCMKPAEDLCTYWPIYGFVLLSYNINILRPLYLWLYFLNTFRHAPSILFYGSKIAHQVMLFAQLIGPNERCCTMLTAAVVRTRLDLAE